MNLEDSEEEIHNDGEKWVEKFEGKEDKKVNSKTKNEVIKTKKCRIVKRPIRFGVDNWICLLIYYVYVITKNIIFFSLFQYCKKGGVVLSDYYYYYHSLIPDNIPSI